MRVGHLGYWLITGALLGFGLLELPGLGLFVFPVGLLLLLIGVVTLRGRETVAGIIGFGALPEAALVYALVAAGPLADAPFMYGSTAVFAVITLVGVVALVLVWRHDRRDTGPATT